jgi:hypothetical protein
LILIISDVVRFILFDVVVDCQFDLSVHSCETMYSATYVAEMTSDDLMTSVYITIYNSIDRLLQIQTQAARR